VRRGGRLAVMCAIPRAWDGQPNALDKNLEGFCVAQVALRATKDPESLQMLETWLRKLRSDDCSVCVGT